MNVLVVNSGAPFIHGGAEELAINLVRELEGRKGVKAELVKLPWHWEPPARVTTEILIHQNMKLMNADMVIGLKFPSYLVPHDNKVLWVLHQFRQVYDFDEAGLWVDTPEARAAKVAVRAADDRCFKDAKGLFVNSPVTRDRMRRFNNFDPKVLYPPVNDPQLFEGGEQGDYIFAGGRVGESKRQHLLIEAAAKVRGPLKIVIAGPPDSAEYADRLRRLAAKLDVEDKVDLRLGLHSREDIAAWARGSLACAYLPYDEDSLGYVTMEAFAAGKAVITTTDSGGLLEIVREDTGFVVEPQAEPLARALEALICDRNKARDLGGAGRALLAARGLTWKSTVDTLLSGT